MKKIFYASLMAASLVATTGCENWLDVNDNPNGPDKVVDPHLYIAPIQAEIAIAIQFDARYLAKYIANWHQGNSSSDTWDRHSYVAANDAAGYIWRSTYYTSGLNLRDMIAKAEEQKKWDFAGVGYALQAFNWQITTDYHGEIIVSQAFNPSLSSFDYDNQEFVYGEVRRLAQKALDAFAKAKAEPHPASRLAESDLIYAGDAAKWEKFVYGLLAINAHHLTNKDNYQTQWAPKVIEYVDKSFTSGADNALVRFEGTVAANANVLGPMRGNFLTVRQSRFITNLLSGRNPVLQDVTINPTNQTVTPNVIDPVFAGEHLKDPRLPIMLSPSPSGKYNGIGFLSSTEITTVADRPYNLYGTTSDAASANATAQGKYLFQNSTGFPLMTYAQLQFIKAEAAYILGNKTTALDAYTKGVVAHMDFVRNYATTAERTVFDQRRATYMANEDLVPKSAAELTLGHILLQKYIAQWGWGFIETWSDLRRYDYNVVTEVDPEIGVRPVFAGYELPPSYQTTNNGKPAQRVRPRYNSEYIWNVEALQQIGGLDIDYHTKEMWFSEK